jgi:hypothetical protein
MKVVGEIRNKYKDEFNNHTAMKEFMKREGLEIPINIVCGGLFFAPALWMTKINKIMQSNTLSPIDLNNLFQNIGWLVSPPNEIEDYNENLSAEFDEYYDFDEDNPFESDYAMTKIIMNKIIPAYVSMVIDDVRTIIPDDILNDYAKTYDWLLQKDVKNLFIF